MNVAVKDQLTDAAYRQVIIQDLGRLNDVQAGLGDHAAAYVLTGKGASGLPCATTQLTENVLEVCSDPFRWPSPATMARRRLMARAHPYDVELMQRYAEVLSASITELPPSAVGTSRVPPQVRVFFTEAFRGLVASLNISPPRVKPLDDQGLVLERALEMLQGLGGMPADFVDVLYATEQSLREVSGRLYRNLGEPTSWFAANATAVQEAMARLPAAARTEIINDLIDWGIASNEAFTELLVRQAGDGAKAVHEAAAASLTLAPPGRVATATLELLAAGDAVQRTGMVDLLARLPLPGAQAALAAHREKEQTARIRAAIDAALAVIAQRSTTAATGDGAQGYTAIGGRYVSLPPQRPLKDGPAARFGDADTTALLALITAENKAITQRNASYTAAGVPHQDPLLDPKRVEGVIGFLNGEGAPPELGLQSFLLDGGGACWLSDALEKLPDKRAITLLRRLMPPRSIEPRVYGHRSQRMNDYLLQNDADLRTIEALDVAAGVIAVLSVWPERRERPAHKGDFLRFAIMEERWQFSSLSGFPQEALWPYLADNLAVFDEAFGLVPSSGVALCRAAAIELLGWLPAVPARYFAALVEIGTGEGKSGRKEARGLLANVPGTDDRLIGLLTDSRAGVRMLAAEWLTARGATGAVAGLRKRLKVEKTERVRAAFLTALATLGEDISPEVGPGALLTEAQQGLKAVKGGKLSFMAFTDLEPLRYRDGSAVPLEVPRWWCELAFKLKQPGGNALLGIYLDQLEAASAVAFSTWVLDSWIAYDTARPSEEEAAAYAQAKAAEVYRLLPKEEVFSSLKAYALSLCLNSGALSKGVLALAIRTPPTAAAEHVRRYLRNHGERTSQAGALLELLAGIGDPVALQVVIAASMRLKQKSVQRLASELITALAQEHEWTLDELADRTVPDAGFDSGGILVLPCGPDQRPYEARLATDLSIKLRNPEGREVASLPSGEDAATKDSKKQLSTAKKALKQIIALQSTRLYEALCVQRSWTVEDWRRCFHDHAVMGRLIQQIVWVAVAQDGSTATFRPTEDGDFIDAQDQRVDVTAFREIHLAFGAVLGEAVSQAWLQHLGDYEVIHPFRQFGRPLLSVPAEHRAKTVIDDRKGWVSGAFNFRGAAAKLGYERGKPVDGGYFYEYRKTFQSVGLTAVISFTGNALPEQNVPVALKELSFAKAQGSGVVTLAEVPALLLSECWNDYHWMATKGSYDPEWEKKYSS